MITCGIDIGKGKHAVAIIDELGRQLVRTRFYDNTMAGAEKLMEELARHAEPAQVHVGMESTGNYWRAYYDFLSKKGCVVDVINPIVTSASSAGDIRGRKTDKRDAESIAEVVMRGKYVRRRDEGLQERKLRALTRQRGFIVEERSAAKLHLSSMVAEAFAEFESLFEDPYGPLALAVLSKYPTACHMARARKTSLAKIVRAHTRGRDADAEARRLVDAAKDSISLACEITDALARCIVSSIQTITALDERVKDIEKTIMDFDPPDLAAKLMAIKGSGKVMPMVVASEFGDISRFNDPRQLQKLAGYAIVSSESGKHKGESHISYRGRKRLRYVLYEAAVSVTGHSPEFRSIYQYYTTRDRNPLKKMQSMIAVACKLIRVFYHILKTGVSFDAKKMMTDIHRTATA